jgi:hypothetical protein
MATKEELIEQAAKLNVHIGSFLIASSGPGSLSGFLADVKEHLLLLTEYLIERDTPAE